MLHEVAGKVPISIAIPAAIDKSDLKYEQYPTVRADKSKQLFQRELLTFISKFVYALV